MGYKKSAMGGGCGKRAFTYRLPGAGGCSLRSFKISVELIAEFKQGVLQ